MFWFKVGVVVLGLVMSFFYGVFAVRIWLNPVRDNKPDQPLALSWWVHQVWINFVGSLIGWATLYFLLFVRFVTLEDGVLKEVGYSDVFLIIVAVVGIMGFLPTTASKIGEKADIKG